MNDILMTDQFKALREAMRTDSKLREQLGFCPLCDSNVKDRVVSLYKGLIQSLYDVYVWCGKNKRHEFEMKDIRQILGTVNYTRFGDLVRFGGIVYKPKDEFGESRKGWYGINMFRAAEFFAGERDIPVQITLNQITNEIEHETRVKVDEFPDLSAFLDEHGLYDSRKLL